MGAGVAVGAAAALAVGSPLLPVWSASLVGAAAGWVWWEVLVEAPAASLPDPTSASEP